MIYRSFFFYLGLRVLLLLGAVIISAYGIINSNGYLTFGGIVLTLIVCYNLYRFMSKRFVEIDDFFEAVKYRDFSRWFSEEQGSEDIRKLHRGFNLVNKTFRDINNERQAQFIYLQKILEIVDVGIIAYNIDDGEVMWSMIPY